MPQSTQRKFLEVTIAGSGKALYIPSDAIQTYEYVPEGKNEHFPQAGSFIRYDYGEGLMFAILNESFEQLQELVGKDNFLLLHLIDDSSLCVRNDLIQAIQEIEDDGVHATRLSVLLGSQVGSLFVKDTFKEIQAQRQ